MAYQAIYRRFRPKTFEEVLGQEHITTTLKNQIMNNNIAHAYLFSGTRGTGKTSTAKIFARAVNCTNNQDGNPCNQCEVCRGILDDSIMDVVEMDAASNNSVEDIRDLREKVKYLPSKGKFKVYIIDEVHMLSKGAFNALLKTLEEPPRHLLFILATTEPQKIPPTILSRCQRYDFKRISSKDMVNNMRDICDELGVEIEDRTLNLITRNSDGAMRDALSILDQCISFSDGEITYDYVSSLLGTVNNDIVFDITGSIIAKDLNRTLELIDNIVQRGKDVHQFIKDMIVHFRNIMISKISNGLEEMIDGSIEYINQIKEQGQKVELGEVIRYINVLSEAETQSKWASQPRIILEVNIIKLLNPAADLSVDGINQRINQIEKMLQSGKVNTLPQSNNIEKRETSDIKNKETSMAPAAETLEAKKSSIIPVEDLSQNQPAEQESLKDISINAIKSQWAEVLKKIKTDRISIHALVMEGKPVSLKDKTLELHFDEGFGFHKEAIEKKDNKDYIEKVVSDFFKTNIKIKCILEGELGDSKGNKMDSLIEKVKNVFGEDIVEVK